MSSLTLNTFPIFILKFQFKFIKIVLIATILNINDTCSSNTLFGLPIKFYIRSTAILIMFKALHESTNFGRSRDCDKNYTTDFKSS